MKHSVRAGSELSVTIVDGWLAKIAEGRSFVDIGGLGANVGNQRVTLAHKYGASSLCIADIIPLGHPWWDRFEEIMAENGNPEVVRHPQFDIFADDAEEVLGRYDVVNSTGIMYHCADLVGYLQKLRRLTNEYAITSMVILPERIENEVGVFETDPATCVFLPALTPHQREILNAHYSAKFPNMMGLDKISPPVSDETISYYVRGGRMSTAPNWWFISREALHAMLKICWFSIEEEYVWREHASVLLLKADPPSADVAPEGDHISVRK